MQFRKYPHRSMRAVRRWKRKHGKKLYSSGKFIGRSFSKSDYDKFLNY